MTRHIFVTIEIEIDSLWRSRPRESLSTRFARTRGAWASDSCLDISGFVNQPARMQSIKISSKVDEDAWNELKALAAETHQNVSGVLTEAIRDYIKRKRVRPEVLNHLERSIADNEELGRLLAE